MKKCIIASAIIINEGKVLMVNHRKLGKWLYPGGHVEDGEFPSEAAIREAREETGLDIRLLDCGDKEFSVQTVVSSQVPFAVLIENVPYKEGAHIHYDLLFLAAPLSLKIKANAAETEGVRWFDEKEVGGISTFENVKDMSLRALAHYRRANP